MSEKPEDLNFESNISYCLTAVQMKLPLMITIIILSNHSRCVVSICILKYSILIQKSWQFKSLVVYFGSVVVSLLIVQNLVVQKR